MRDYNASRYSPSFGPKQRRSSRSPSPNRRRPSTSSKPPIKPDYNPSGKLAADKLQKEGIRLKYDEPTDRTEPSRKWRLLIFKGDSEVGSVDVGEKSCYRLGRDRLVNDVVLEHESCSKQHAVIQHRLIHIDQGFGKYETEKRPYLIDLESTHGTQLNGKDIEPGRFIELRAKDIIRFAYSTREYVFLSL